MSDSYLHAPSNWADPRQLARLISRTRLEFSEVHQSARPVGGRSFLVVGDGTPIDSVAFERAFRQAAEEKWLETLVAALVAADFFPTETSVATRVQSLIEPSRGMSDHTLVTAGSITAQNRLCRVEVSGGEGHGEAIGTGYLVGPSTVLTCFHVVRSLIDVFGNGPKEDSARFVSVWFDYRTGATSEQFRVPNDWLMAWSSAHTSELTVGSVGSEVDLVDKLDFAVIQVAGSPGVERGYYPLDQAVEPTEGSDVLLLQHPRGARQKISRGQFGGFRAGTSGQRLLHSANALEGSSGGLLVDGSHRLVGLHQGAVPNPNGGEVEANTAISAQAILQAIRQQGVLIEESRFAHPFQLSGGRGPIIGREDCQRIFRTSGQSFFWVRSRSRAKGVSFSAELMQACLPASENVIGRVEVADFDSDAKRSAEILLEAIGLRWGGLPNEQSVDSSDGTWIVQLVRSLIQRITAGYDGRMVWIVIDELVEPLPEGGCRDLLSELYRQVALTANIRIVLLDLPDLPDSFPDHQLEEEDIVPPREEDVDRYLRRRLVARGCLFTDQEIRMLTTMIINDVGLDVEALAEHIRRKVDPLIDERQVA